MCECVSKFKSAVPSLALPLDPQEVLCAFPEELQIEHAGLSRQWDAYLQRFLMAVIHHQPSPAIRFDNAPTHKPLPQSKKKRRRPMSPKTKSRCAEMLAANFDVVEIAEQLRIPPRSVSDLKYALGKRSAPSAASGQ